MKIEKAHWEVTAALTETGPEHDLKTSHAGTPFRPNGITVKATAADGPYAVQFTGYRVLKSGRVSERASISETWYAWRGKFDLPAWAADAARKVAGL